MNPILLDLGIVKIYWYSIMIFLALIVAGTYFHYESKKFNITEEFSNNLFFWVIIVGVIGARLYYVVFNFDMYSGNLLSILKIWEGGLAIHGGILFGLIFTILYSKKYKIKPLLVIDIIVVGLIIAQAIGRWGNFFNGEAHGGITTLENLQDMFIPSFIIKGMFINGNYYVPTFYFESIWCIVGFIFLLIMKKRKYIKIGQLTSLYFIWYGIGRFFIESMRTDSLMLGNLKMAQVISIIMILIGIIMYIVLNRGSKFNNLYNKDYEQYTNNEENGFTLVETLTVISIIALIGLITVPIISRQMDNSNKKAFKESINSIIDSIKIYRAENDYPPYPPEGIDVNSLEYEHKTEIKSGYIKYIDNKYIIENLSNGDYCANGEIDNLIITEGLCNESD